VTYPNLRSAIRKFDDLSLSQIARLVNIQTRRLARIIDGLEATADEQASLSKVLCVPVRDLFLMQPDLLFEESLAPSAAPASDSDPKRPKEQDARP
jgi:hypothetical protein